MLKIGTAMGALLLFAYGPTAAAAECGKVQLAEMNWSSAALVTNVDRFILEHGYGCDASIVPGDTMPTGTSMIEKGEPDVNPEMWSNSMKEALDKGVAEGRLAFAGHTLADGGEEGFWVPKYLVDKDPSLATIEGIIANAKMFKHPENPDKSGFFTCPSGWNCQIGTGNNFKALKLADAGFELVDPGSGAALAGSIAKAYERQEPWVGYYWAPTPVLGKYEMVKVKFAEVDEEHFTSCIALADCTDPAKASEWPIAPVQTLVTSEFAKRAPEAMAYFGRRSYKNADVNVLLAWMEENQADGEIVSEHFLKNYESIWTQWVEPEVADKVRAALAKL